MKKLFKWALIVIPVLIIIAVVIVILTIDRIAKRTIETQATASTNLVTTLNSANISIFGGKVSLNELKIGSPKGFDAPTMFDMKNLKVGVSYGQLTGNPIHIAEISVDSPRLVVEQVGGKFNVYSAMDQMPKSEPSTMRLIIDKLSVNNTQIVVRPGVSFLKPEYSLAIPSVSLQNVGNADGNQNGAAIKDVLSQVLNAMMAKVKDSSGVPTEMKAFLTTNPDDLKAAVQQQVQAQSQQYIDKGKQQASDELQKGLQGLLGGKKK